jgi:hypothetical protein
MKLTIPQKNIVDNSKRFTVAICGRRFGKTLLAMRQLAKQASKGPKRNIYYIAPSYRMAKSIMWEMLKDKLQGLNWVKRVHETELSITLLNNSVISLKGADNFDSLRGVPLNYVVFDEFAYMDSDVWTHVIRPALSDRLGEAMFISTPVGKSNWAYDLYHMQDSLDDWVSFSYTTLEGGNVPLEEIEAARRDLDEKTFKQEYEASFETSGSVVFYDFDRDLNKSDYVYTGGPIIVGMDFNNTPMTAAIATRIQDSIHFFDEIVLNTSNTDEMVQEIKNRYPNVQVTVYPDPACRQVKTSAGGRTDFSILQNAGFIVKTLSSHMAVRDRINSTNARIKSSAGVRNLFVNPKCKFTIESLEKLNYKENSSVVDKNSGYDHMSDALSYLVSFLYPIKTNYNERAMQPTPFGVMTR